MNIRTKIAAASLVATGAFASMAGVSFAGDCYVASRSTQSATTASAKSGNWWSVSEFLAIAGYTPTEVQAIVPVVLADSRIPQNFSMFFNLKHPMELAEPMPERLASNGKGIDHADDTGIFDALLEDAISVTGHGPSFPG